MSWFVKALKNYGVFRGRARRKEYWYFILFYVLGCVILSAIDGAMAATDQNPGWGVLTAIFVLAMLVPSVSVGVRRLHDTDRSGWWLLLSAIPLIGTIVLLVFTVQDSQPGENRFGPNPKTLD